MSKFGFAFNHPDYSDSDLNSSIENIMSANFLCSLASISNQQSYIHTAFYCFNEKLELFFLSGSSAKHNENFRENSTVAIAIYDSHQTWDGDKKGLQLFGRCELASGTKAIESITLYIKRFTGLKEWVKHPDDFIKGAIDSKLFHIEVDSLKLLDEENFGEENFISLSIPK